MLDKLLDELAWRGLAHDHTPGLADRLRRGTISGYVGFDPTAPSLQLGNLVPIMLLAHLQRAGGRPIVLVGGGTGLIGDPSGRQSERPLLDEATVTEHIDRQRSQFERFLDFGNGETGAITVDNAEWLRPLGLVPFLRDIGKHFTVSLMLQKESVKARLEEGISFTEFTYMLLQAYDFVHLYRTMDCELQLGGSDQWGNITAGIELIRRLEGGEAHGLSAPLLTTASGRKFGKTEAGAVWLDPDMTSAYRFYQFWINADDRDVNSYLRVFTFETRETIADLMEQHATKPERRIPHAALASDVTTRVHGSEAARRAGEASQILFGGLDPRTADAGIWEMLRRELPHTEIDLSTPVSNVDLVTVAGLAKSKGEARRLLTQGGIYRNGEPIEPAGSTGPDDVLAGKYIWLRRGKKTDAIVLTRQS